MKAALNSLLAFVMTLGLQAFAEPEIFEIDPTHTFPGFEADHMGGLSKWRGKINSSSGKVIVDFDAKEGSIEVMMDMTTIDFGLDEMNEHAMSDDMFDVEKFPTATYAGQLIFDGEDPASVQGNLTLHGISQPVDLDIKSFKCMFHPMQLAKVCGAEAEGSIQRDDFGIDYAKSFGFDMDVGLRIGIEAIKVD